ncbi:MAG: glycosyltransferase [Verrucomicrobiota bacterium]|jgi:glycosyltransferase involved in cell wall biosynthesis
MPSEPSLNDTLVSVVMSTYRDAPAVLDRALDSLLGQNYPELEVIIVFEPGDENAPRVEQKYRDSRVRVIRPAERVGRCGAYNVGIQAATGRYLARMDSDDQCLPDRISRQISFLRAHPDIAVVGSAVNLYDRQGNFCGVRHFPETHEQFMGRLPFVNPICHPTVVWDRRKVEPDGLFSAEFSAACDDMELWLRWAAQGHRFANLPECLLNYTQPDNYTRNRLNWRYMFAARWRHRRLIWSHPAMLLGLPVAGVFAISPQWFITLCTGRSRFSDWFRSIR